MNIAIDTSPLNSGHKVRGVGKYTKLLIESLKKYESQHSYTLIERGQKVPNNVDLVHYPYFDPFFLTLPLITAKPTVITVHDLIPLVFPDKFPRGLRGELKWNIQRLALRNAKKIITDSQNSKRDIVKIVGTPERKISVVHLAPDPAIIAGSAKSSKPERFFIYVGDLNWNKNIHGLLEGFSRVQTGIKLMIVGQAFLNKNLSEAIAVREYVIKLGIDDRVRFFGYVSDEKLGVLYASSLGCMLPSFYEGFGLPVLEAMACGAPVIVSHGSSLDEIAGPAFRVDPANPDTITDACTKLANVSRQERSTIVEKGRVWSAEFTWEKVAQNTVRVYESCI